MEKLLLDIASRLRAGQAIDDKLLASLVRKANTGVSDVSQHISKKRLLPFLLKVQAQEPERYESWGLEPEIEKALVKVLRAKPSRTASGVATITVITKPWPCGSDCRYCPNDLRMPKSYLSEEPACQRAERNFFDPYLQVASRLHTLEQMGHVTDKVEIIVLGGTWCDYPESYQLWFMCEVFAALNAGEDERMDEVKRRRPWYWQQGIESNKEKLAAFVFGQQKRVDALELTYGQAWQLLYGKRSVWDALAAGQRASMEELEQQHALNVNAKHRCVGLVIETRPDTITTESLHFIRQLGCTKVQTGVQTLNPQVMEANGRVIDVGRIAHAFELLRAYGFKIHSHFMANLLGSDPQMDVADYQRFMTEAAFQPDEVKLYPCALIDGTKLCADFEQGRWAPYDEETLVDLLARDMAATPCFTRVSRMIRDFSADDIKAGNKKTNLRQAVDLRLREVGAVVEEIRSREIMLNDVHMDDLELLVHSYETSNTSERFLQWVTPKGGIAGFCRLSLPHAGWLEEQGVTAPGQDNAMIREVHVYGKVAGIDEGRGGAQHMGLGRGLVEEACHIASEAGYSGINVISAIGTRGYYEKLGFTQRGLYHHKAL